MSVLKDNEKDSEGIILYICACKRLLSVWLALY